MTIASTGFAAEPVGTRTVLENGMVLLVAERHELPMVTLSMSFRAGSTAEPAGKAGIASLTASLMTQGTKRRTATQISREIDFIGGSLSVSGGDDTATASLRVLKKDLAAGMDLLWDVLVSPAFDQQEIDRKRREILAEVQRQKEEPETIAAQAFTKAVFGGHPYGTVNDDIAQSLPKLTRDDIAGFHRSSYGPDTAIVSVVGDVTAQEMAGILTKRFKGWKRDKALKPSAAAPPARTRTEVLKIEKDTTQANIAAGHLGISRNDPDFYAVSVMNFILGGGGFSSRLMDNIRDNRGLAYDVHSLFSAKKEPGEFQVWVQTKSESANEAVDEFLKEIRRIRTEPVSDRELADAKAYLTGSFPLRMDSSAKIAGLLTNIELYGLGLDYPSRYPVIINAITKDDILRVAKKYLDPDRMVIVVVGNQDRIKLKY